MVNVLVLYHNRTPNSAGRITVARLATTINEESIRARIRYQPVMYPPVSKDIQKPRKVNYANTTRQYAVKPYVRFHRSFAE